MNKVLALLFCALPALATAAQPDVEALTLNPQNKLYCNPQTDWCVGIKVDGSFEENGPFASSRTLRANYRLWDLPEIPDFSRFTVWPHLIRLSEERALVGVIGPNEPDYKEEIQIPGGSFSRRDLYLFVVDLGDKSSSLVQLLPYSTRASIRGCMNEADARRREANCMDEYRYDATVKALAGAQPYPDLQVTTQATRAPAGASRYADPARQPAPTAAPRQPQSDKQCSYTVTYKWQADGAVYRPATPLPDCAEFLEAQPRKG
ncbi:MAG: hypothetical protein ACN6O8_14730 [Achromobacter sp.]|uniref:hypothetical protein n=1 Tax=Achromobacter sp. TaxID=134375 RepID=UPI003D05CA05